jgi:peptide/nickel transport system permease protein
MAAALLSRLSGRSPATKSARSPFRTALRTGEGRTGLGLLAAVVVVAVIGPMLAPYSPTATGVCIPLSGPSLTHLLGCDDLGRDVLSRVLTGGGSVLLPPAAGTALAIVVGGAVGLASGYLGGRLDVAVTRVLDLFLAIPPLLTVLVIAATFGGSNTVIVGALALISAPKIARVLRGATQNLRTSDFVVAAQARGERLGWILGREFLPNLFPTLLVEVAIRYTFAIIFVATLNFLGLGQQPPSSNWGLMVSEGRNIIAQAPVAALAPAFAIAMLVVGVHLSADALARALTADGTTAVAAA